MPDDSGPGIAEPRAFVHERLARDMQRLCEAVYAAGQADKRPAKERRGAYHQKPARGEDGHEPTG